MSSRKANLERILTLVPVVIANPGISVGALAERFGCSKTEIHADLARILLCGVPPYLPNDFVLVDLEGDRVYMDFASSFARPVSLLVEEALALELALEDLLPLVSGRAEEVVRGLAAKVERVLAERDTSAQEAASERVDGPASRSERVVLQELTLRLTAGEPVEIDYYTAARDASSRRIVWPRSFEEREGILYLRAHCTVRGDERSFRVDRIRSVVSGADVQRRAAELTQAGASDPEPPAIRVVLRFEPDMARYVAERYEGVERDPGTGRATLCIEARHFEWIYAWLLTFGGQAEILEPPEARAGFVQRLDRIVNAHSG